MSDAEEHPVNSEKTASICGVIRQSRFEITFCGLPLWSVDVTLFEYLLFAFVPLHQSMVEYTWFWHHSIVIRKAQRSD
jgi:hypothetical protein